MKKILIENNEGLIGDFLCTLPIMFELSKTNYVKFYGNFNKWVWRGLQFPTSLRYIEDKSKLNVDYFDEIIELSCSKSWQYCFDTGSKLHMLQGHFAVNNLSIPQLPIKFEDKFNNLESYIKPGIVFSPFSRTDDGNYSKCWHNQKWKELLYTLSLEYNLPIYLVSSKNDDRRFYLENLECLHVVNYQCAKVCDVLRNAKLFISVDNGLSHLAHFLDIKTHVLSYPNASPKNFAENPNALMLHEAPYNVSINSMYDLCVKTLDKNR